MTFEKNNFEIEILSQEICSGFFDTETLLGNTSE
jgi:hypothetical protein